MFKHPSPNLQTLRASTPVVSKVDRSCLRIPLAIARRKKKGMRRGLKGSQKKRGSSLVYQVWGKLARREFGSLRKTRRGVFFLELRHRLPTDFSILGSNSSFLYIISGWDTCQNYSVSLSPRQAMLRLGRRICQILPECMQNWWKPIFMALS